jgi:predicted nucleotidyltransferase
MNIKFAVIVLISLILLSAQAQSMEAEKSLKDLSTEDASTKITMEAEEVEKDLLKGILKKDSEEIQHLAQIAKV